MYELLRNNMIKCGLDQPQELEKVLSAFNVINVKRKRQILSEGNIANFLFFVNSGLIRMYTTDSNMEERTFDFGAEETWFGDLKSFADKQSSDTNIEAIEDTQILTIEYETLQKLYKEFPRLERVGRLNAEDKYIKLIDRLKKVNHTNYSAEDRYLEFLRFYEKIAHRIPSCYIASYLGIATETLSRVKRNIMNSGAA